MLWMASPRSAAKAASAWMSAMKLARAPSSPCRVNSGLPVQRQEIMSHPLGKQCVSELGAEAWLSGPRC